VSLQSYPLPGIKPLYASYPAKDFIGSDDAFEVAGLNDRRVDWDSCQSVSNPLLMLSPSSFLIFFQEGKATAR
jgi:hypothetical protein